MTGEVNTIYSLGDDRTVVADTLVEDDAFGWSALKASPDDSKLRREQQW
jgi:hypothetical protein